MLQPPSRQGGQLVGQEAVHGRGHLVPAQRIAHGRVKLGRDEDQLWVVLSRHGHHDVLECFHVLVVSRSCSIPRNINIESFSFTLTNLIFKQ